MMTDRGLARFAVAGCLAVSGCVGLPVATRPPVAPVITNASTEPLTFNPTQGQMTTLRYTLNRPGTVSVAIQETDGRAVRTLLEDAKQAEGPHESQWDGTDAQGRIVPDDAYTYVIRWSDGNAHVTDDLTDETYGETVEPTDQVFDARAGEIRYRLPVASRVRIRLGVAKGPLLRTLLDWMPQEAGFHAITWDGKDETGQVAFNGHPNVTGFLAAYSLPGNSVLTTGNPDSRALREAQDAFGLAPGPGRHTASQRPHEVGAHHHEPPQPERLPRHGHGEVAPDVHHHGAAHAEHPRAVCRAPRLTLQVSGQSTDARGVPIVEGLVPVRLELDPQDQHRIRQERFGWALFVDFVFWHEDMQGLSPVTFWLDTRGFNDGDHLLSANLESYEDHIGTATQLVHVRRAAP